MKLWLARSTMFGVFFALSAFTLALLGKLTGDYVAAITAIHGFVVTRAIADDYHQRACAKDSNAP